ncbi:kelch domain-containing protein 8B [Elysia marginata]|uniref:Kelch domain-containing protein 8B n=1 Tax=Elysia marginata TaxID=1093978 RepID=A0AAV4JM32_9GAST|nr:kelch domain-containing protein 8B [Elysia marginata]
MGGMSADTSPFDKFVELDLETFKWQLMPAMPTPRYATFAFLVDDKLYVIGGRQGKIPSVAFEMFDFDTRQWTSLPDIPSKRVFAMYATDGKHIFSVGGLLQPANQGFSDICESYNIEKGTWTTCQNMPTKRGDFAVGIVGGKLVCAGGLGNDGKPLSVVEVFDVDSNSWVGVTDMPSSHCSCSYTMYSEQLYVCGGLSCRGPSNSMEALRFD